MTSRFAAYVTPARNRSKKGEEIIYWPNGNHTNTLHVAKLITVIRWHHSRMKKITTINIHPGDWKKSRFRTVGTGTIFYSYLLEKRFFFVYCTGKEKAWQKENRMKTGCFWTKATKAHAHYSKFSAKVTSWKYLVTKGGSPGHLILAMDEPPVGFIQIEKPNLTRTFVPEFSFRYCLGQKFFLTGEPDAK